MTADTSLDLTDIQLPILRNAGEHARYLFVTFRSAEEGRRWLSEIVANVSTSGAANAPAPAHVNIAFTFAGLRALGVSGETLNTFPAEFQEGMASRAEKLGLTGPSHPSHWEMGGPANPEIHAAVFIFASSSEVRDAEASAFQARLGAQDGVDVTYSLDADSLPGWREHFGFVDGISQPAIEGSGIEPIDPYEPRIAAGEFVLGHPDELGEVASSPVGWIAMNGSFLAYQKIYENVAAFRSFLSSLASSTDEEELLAAKLMGRWRSGAPLVLAPTEDNPSLVLDPTRRNAFGYQSMDPHGLACPIGAHARRMNPRDMMDDSNRHRVIRRGLPYGPVLKDGAPEDGVDRGLAGFFFNSSLGRQYEVIQVAWVNDPKFYGLENDIDPIVGNHDGTYNFTIQRKPFRKEIQGIPSFTTVRAGSYLFMPGLRALDALAKG